MNEIFSRKNLNTRYFGDKSLGRIGEEYEDKGYSYRIDIVLELKSNNLRQIPSPKKVCIASLGMKGYAIEGRNDRRRFSELIFLLAAKLKYDRLEMRRSYDGS
jgi:hypothetical protein